MTALYVAVIVEVIVVVEVRVVVESVGEIVVVTVDTREQGVETSRFRFILLLFITGGASHILDSAALIPSYHARAICAYPRSVGCTSSCRSSTVIYLLMFTVWIRHPSSTLRLTMLGIAALNVTARASEAALPIGGSCATSIAALGKAFTTSSIR